jgi:inorganic pyrophosphatase
MWSTVQDIADLPQSLLKEIKHFFQVYKDLEDKVVSTEGYGGRAEALDVIAQARARIGRE